MFLEVYVDISEVAIQGYVTYRKDRNRHGGGIMVYVRDTIQSSLHPSLITPTDTELLWICIRISHTKYTFGAFYCPPSSGEDPLLKLQQSLQLLNPSELQNLIICGDFNIDQGQVNQSPLSVCFDHFLTVFDLSQVVVEPTRAYYFS